MVRPAAAPAKISYACLMNPVQANKLLLSKWTAVFPQNKEKHFVVTKLIAPASPGAPADEVDLEAVHSGRVQRIAWRALRDDAHWRQGWV